MVTIRLGPKNRRVRAVLFLAVYWALPGAQESCPREHIPEMLVCVGYTGNSSDTQDPLLCLFGLH